MTLDCIELKIKTDKDTVYVAISEFDRVRLLGVSSLYNSEQELCSLGKNMSEKEFENEPNLPFSLFV